MQNHKEEQLVAGTDRISVLSFISGASPGGDHYTSQSGETVGVLKQLKDEMTADLDTDGGGKVNLREIFDDMEGPASLRDKYVNAFKEADEDGDFMKLVDKMQGTELHSSMVLLRKCDPGFVDALDTDTEVMDDGCQEQMLDKLHADLYFDAEHFVCVDTDTAFVRDLTRKMWMQDGVKSMSREGERLALTGSCVARAVAQHRSKQATQEKEKRMEK